MTKFLRTGQVGHRKIIHNGVAVGEILPVDITGKKFRRVNAYVWRVNGKGSHLVYSSFDDACKSVVDELGS